MKHQFRIVFAILVGLLLMTGVFSLMQVTADTSELTKPAFINDLFISGLAPTGITVLSDLEVQAYLPALSTNYGKCLTSPTLLTPTNGAQLDTLIPTFWWDNGIYPNADRIRIQIAADPQMGIKVKSFSGSHPAAGPVSYSFSSNFSPGTTHYWQAYFECDGGIQSPYSEIWSFATGSGGTILPPPTLKTPANGTVLTNNAATLEWNPVGGAAAYIVSYRPTGESWSIIQTTIDPQAEIDNLQSATTYEWWVKVRNDYGYSEDSEKWQFTTPTSGTADSLPPTQQYKVIIINGILQEVEE